jgi:hypothetical protein
MAFEDDLADAHAAVRTSTVIVRKVKKLILADY